VVTSPKHESASAGPSSLRILIADDDRDSVLTLALLLREEGHVVRTVHSGGEVMNAVRDFDPEVVLLDIALPLLSGWEIARMIRKQSDRRVTLIGISGKYNHSADNILCETGGFDHYVLKPYDPQSLIALIAQQRLRPARH
jgi:DNA-binding response OmpR family regulator